MSRLKRFIAVFCCVALFAGLCIPAQAADMTSATVTQTEIDLGDGWAVTDVLTVETQTRASTRYASRLRTFTFLGNVIAKIKITAQFRYDGSTVSVIYKSVSQKDTYDGWKFTQSSFTASGGTVRLKGTLTKTLLGRAAVDMALTCDKNGNIT